jgi:hypothetical protein
VKKALLQRLERLEAQLKPAKPIALIWIYHVIEKRRRQSLAADERIVLDVYGETGETGWARERITTDPQDEGRHYPPGDLLEQLQGGQQ